MAARTLGRDLEAPVDVLHQHVPQLRIVQRVDGGIDLGRLDREEHLQGEVQGIVLWKGEILGYFFWREF